MERIERNNVSKKVKKVFVMRRRMGMFAARHQSKNYEKIKLFGGDGSSTTLTDVAVCIQSPLLFPYLTSKNCDR
jgi:hypothetical protein